MSVDNLNEAIEEQEDLIRELNRVPECEIRAQEAQNVLDYLVGVRNLSLKYKDLGTLLDTR